MRLKLSCIFFAFLVTSIFTCQTFAINTSASSAILIEQESGRVLFEEAADEERLIASITKIMTAVVALEYGELSELYTVTTEDMAEGSSMYLKPGDILTLEELLYGLMLASGNDAALAVAHCVCDELTSFVALMNQTAEKLGMMNTSFANPNGLDQAGHYSTARDMAVLAAHALDNETFRRIVSTETVTIGERYLKNHNKLLALCDGCIGVKTGYTKAAGRTLVSAAERQGMTLVCVTLKDGDDWNDHIKLFDYGFSSCHMEIPVRAGQIMASTSVSGGAQTRVQLVADGDFLYPVKEGEKMTIRVQAPVSVSAPVMDGEKLGNISIFLDGVEIGTVPLVASSSVVLQGNDDEPGILKQFLGK